VNAITALGITNKDVREVVRQAVEAGCTAQRTNGGHVKITAPSGGSYFLGTTQPAARTSRYLRTALRRMGVEVPR
jgi:FMN-dependent NADH-azoreductase